MVPQNGEKEGEPIPELVSGSEQQIEDRLDIWREILAKHYENEIKIEGNIGPEINFILINKNGDKVPVTEIFSYGKNFGYQLDVFSGGKKIGFLRYQAGSDKTSINMGTTKVDSDFRKLGINTLLFQHMTKLHPGAEELWSKMDDDNWEVYDDAIKKGKSPMEAINVTPVGKVRSRAGWKLDEEKSILPVIKEGFYFISSTIRPVYRKKDGV